MLAGLTYNHMGDVRNEERRYRDHEKAVIVRAHITKGQDLFRISVLNRNNLLCLMLITPEYWRQEDDRLWTHLAF